MRALLALTIANIKSYLRDRAALFWTLAFPLIFIFMFGFIFQGGGSASLKIGWVDQDESAASTQLRVAFATPSTNELSDLAQQDALDQMQSGKLDAIIVVPAGYGAALGRGLGGQRWPDVAHRLHRPVAPEPVGVGLPDRRGRARRRQPRRAAADRRAGGRDPPDREPQLHQLLRAEHARPVGDAGRDLRGRPAGRRPREAHPQAARRDAAAALAAGRLERADAPAHRARPGGDHRRGRGRCSSASWSPDRGR